MENEENSTKQNLSKHTADQKEGTGTERSDAESEIFTIISEKEESSSKKEIKSFPNKTKKNSNEILKDTTTLEIYSEGVNGTKKGDKSIQESTGNPAARINADQLDKASSLREESSYDGSRREIKNPRKIGDMTITGQRQHQRSFRDLIGKREQRKEELEKMEGDLRQRLDMLECSMPAVMVWNIWRMSQGAPVCKMKRILEKQFEDTRELPCRSTPSRHYDCRVREVEAERKLTLKKVEEARALWSEKLVRLQEREKKIEEARRIQEEQKNAIKRLSEEAKALREETEGKAMETNESCQYGECGDTRCKQKWLDKIASVTSIESGDIKCLEKLQQLAEEEVSMKRDIAELECREEAYMRTLQQADELWSRIEVDATRELREQLDLKTATNKQFADRVCELEDELEKCQTRMAACRTELEKFLSIEKIEATIGRDDDVAKVIDKGVTVKTKIVHRPVGRVDDVATVKDGQVMTRVKVADGETLTRIEIADQESLAKVVSIDVDAEATMIGNDKFVSVKPDLADLAIDRPMDLVKIEDAESVVRPEDFIYEQRKFKEVREYLAKLDSLEELYKDDGKTCAPDFICNDEVISPTGMTNEELIALGIEPTAPIRKLDEKIVVSERERDRPEKLTKLNDIEVKERKADKISNEIERKLIDQTKETIPDDVEAQKIKTIEVDRDIVMQRDTILSWIDKIDTIRRKAAKLPSCHEVKKDADILAEQVGSYIGMKLKEVKEEIIAEDKQKKIERNNEIKREQEAIVEINLQESIALKNNDAEFMESNSIILSHPEETAERKAPRKPISEPELQPTLTKEEITIGMESEHAERNEKKISVLNKMVIEREETVIDTVKADNILPIPEENNRSRLVEESIGNSKEAPPSDEIKRMDIEETRSHMEIVENEERKEIEEPPSISDAKEENTEKIEINVLPIVKEVSVEEVSTVVEEKVEVEESPSILNTTKVRAIVKEKEIEEVVPAADIIQEEMEIAQVPQITDIIQEEEIEVEVPSLTAEAVTEDKIEMIQPITKLLPTIKKEIDEIETIEQPVSEMDIKEERDEEIVKIPQEVTPPVELSEEGEEKEISPLRKQEILTEVELPMEQMVKEEQEEVSIEEKQPEVIEIELQIPIADMKPIETEISAIRDSRLMAQPYLNLAKIEEKEISPLRKQEILTEVELPMEQMVKEEQEEVSIEEKQPEVIEIELQIPIADMKPIETEIPAIRDSRLMAQPYLKIEEKEILQIIPSMTSTAGSDLRLSAEVAQPEVGIKRAEATMVAQTELAETKIVQNEIVQTKIVETEIVQVTTQTVSTAEPTRIRTPILTIGEYLKPTELKVSSTEIAGDRPEITGRKMLWRKPGLKDQSTVTTANIGSQTNRTSHVSYDRVVRDERERARADELLRSIKIAAQLARPDTEREIRTINYGRKSDETRAMACNCCWCGKISTTPSMVSKLEFQPQIDAKTAMPPAFAALKRILIPSKIDRPISYDRLCPDCTAKIQDKMSREKQHIEKITKQISSDQESCGYASSTDKPRRRESRRKVIEKKDQACLAKIHKRKIHLDEQKGKDDLQPILEDSNKLEVEPLSSSCICFKLEKTGVEPIRKGNCYCAD